MIKYRNGYDGQLAETATFQLPKALWPKEAITTEFIELTTRGLLTIRSGYAWDYASVPFTHWLSNLIAGKKSKVPSLVHDALCQLHRQGYLTSIHNARLHIDKHFYTLLRERKFWRVRARAWYKAVRIGAKRFKQKPKKVHTAP